MATENPHRTNVEASDAARIQVDIFIVGAGPVGLLCAYLARLCGLSTLIVDKSSRPLRVGRADALNARTLQLLEIGRLFEELYPSGKPCNTSSVWAGGTFVSRQSAWWDDLEGCFHKHFLMLGQAFVEQLLDRKATSMQSPVRRNTSVQSVQITGDHCSSVLSSGEVVDSRFVIGADGSRSFVREIMQIPFEITRPQITWAVLDGVIETDFPKVPEIIVFQADTSDVAWIPREGDIDRFYVRMDTDTFTMDEAVARINRAMSPHRLRFKSVEWFSRFSVKESVAARYAVDHRIFLAGDACHIHSVNGGMGLNTGLADAFNLIWKLHQVLRYGSPAAFLSTYEQERKPVAASVIQTSGALVRTTRESEAGTHALDYVRLVEKRAGDITGMGIRYGREALNGTRLFDFLVHCGEGSAPEAMAGATSRVYSLLDYRHFTLLVFCDAPITIELPDFVKLMHIQRTAGKGLHWTSDAPYEDQLILVRPDGYIASSSSVENTAPVSSYIDLLRPETYTSLA